MRTVKLWVMGALALAASVAIGQNSNIIAPTEAPNAKTAAVQPSLPTTTASREFTKDDVDVWLDGYLPYALNSGDIPGAVVTIVKDGQLLRARGFGNADVAKTVRKNRIKFG